MSDEFIRLSRPKARNLPDSDTAQPFETRGNELALFVLRPDSGSIWLSQEVRTREQVNWVLDFLDQARAKLLGLRDAS